MTKLIVVLWVLIFSFGIIMHNRERIEGIESLKSIAYAGNGNIWVAFHNENATVELHLLNPSGETLWNRLDPRRISVRRATIEFHLINSHGMSLQSFSVPREVHGFARQISYMAVDQDGNLFILNQYVNPATGIYEEGMMSLSIYRGGFFERLFGTIRNIELDMTADDGTAISRYLHIRADSEISLTGISEDGFRLIRRIYDREALISGNAVPRTLDRMYTTGRYVAGRRVYEPVFMAVAADVYTVFLSKSGRVFVSAENARQTVLIYPPPYVVQPNYVLTVYPVRGHTHNRDIIFEIWSREMGSAEWRVMTIPDGTTVHGVQAFFSQGPAREGIIRNINTIQSRTFTIESVIGMVLVASALSLMVLLINFIVREFKHKMPFTHRLTSLLLPLVALTALASFVIWRDLRFLFGIPLALLLWIPLVEGIINPLRWFRQRKYVVTKVMCAAIPVVSLALVLVSSIIYFNYRNVLIATQETHAQDAGNLLRTLLAASVDELDMSAPSPEMYGSPEFEELRGAMDMLGFYISSIFYSFEEDILLTGIDRRLPYFFPLDIRNMGRDETAVFRQAALRAEQQRTIIDDNLGKRVIYITPVATARGDALFLLETGIFQREIDRQLNEFLLLLILIVTGAVMASTLILRKASNLVLKHLGEFVSDLEKLDMEAAIDDTKYISSNDEINYIIKKFNDRQKLALQRKIRFEKGLADYRRFVPDRVVKMLNSEMPGIEGFNTDELIAVRAELDLSSGTKDYEDYFVLSAELTPEDDNNPNVNINLANDFLQTILSSAERLENTMYVLPDGANLVKLRVLLKAENGHDALKMVSNVYEREGGFNLNRNGMKLSFFLHKVRLQLRICGKDNRYVLVMASEDFDKALAVSHDLRRKCSSLVVSQEVYQGLSQPIMKMYRHRLAGWVKQEGRNLVLYDFYEFAASDAAKAQYDKTNEDFKKALEFFMAAKDKNDYVKAHNTFIRICHENKEDRISEYYRQECIKKLPMEFRIGDRV